MVSCLPGEQSKEDRWTEVQKKITPWRLGINEQEPELQLVPQQRAARLGKLHGALLVVASLIDKPTNLGGRELHVKLHYFTFLWHFVVSRCEMSVTFSLIYVTNITSFCLVS